MEKVLLTINTFSLVYCSWFSPKVHFLIDWGKVALSHKSSENKLMFTLRPVVSCVALFFFKWIFERNTKSVFEKYTSIQNIVEVAVMTSLWCLLGVENISLTLCPVFGCHFVFLKSVLEKYTFSVVSSVALRPPRLSDKLQVFASLRKPSIKMFFYIQINEWIVGYKLYTIYYTIRKQKGHKSGIK